MNATNQITTKRSEKFPKWLTIFRVLLGFILLAKGISFFRDSTLLDSMINNRGLNMFATGNQTIYFIITYLNLLGGVFIISGFITRWASIVQIPILIGAVFFVNVAEGMTFTNKELILSVIALILLIVFAIKGSGALSADEFFRSYTNAGEEKGHLKKLFQ